MKGIESDLADLERTLRKLEAEYEQFLTGKVRVLPLKTEDAVQKLIRVYSTRGIQNPALRFRYANIVARYNSFKNVWDRKVREMEEGRVVGRPFRAARQVEPRAAAAASPQPDRKFMASDLRREEAKMAEIFESYRSLRAECGQGAERLRLENFTKLLSEKVERLKSSKKCDKVEIRLQRDNDKCRILVRPVRKKT
jgi:hypothetical protein